MEEIKRERAPWPSSAKGKAGCVWPSPHPPFPGLRASGASRPHTARRTRPLLGRPERPDRHPELRKHQEREKTHSKNSFLNSQTLQTSPSGCPVRQTKDAKTRSFPQDDFCFHEKVPKCQAALGNIAALAIMSRIKCGVAKTLDSSRGKMNGCSRHLAQMYADTLGWALKCEILRLMDKYIVSLSHTNTHRVNFLLQQNHILFTRLHLLPADTRI